VEYVFHQYDEPFGLVEDVLDKDLCSSARVTPDLTTICSFDYGVVGFDVLDQVINVGCHVRTASTVHQPIGDGRGDKIVVSMLHGVMGLGTMYFVYVVGPGNRASRCVSMSDAYGISLRVVLCCSRTCGGIAPAFWLLFTCRLVVLLGVLCVVGPFSWWSTWHKCRTAGATSMPVLLLGLPL
jgi:hypothetical protein